MRNSCRATLLLLAAVAALSPTLTAAAEEPCPFPGQRPMLVTQLFFGQRVGGGGRVTPREWRSFLARTVTPRLPDGFTVSDGYGQWLDPGTRKIAREPSKVLLVAAPDDPALRARIGEIVAAYRDHFRQQSVGVVTSRGCAAF